MERIAMPTRQLSMACVFLTRKAKPPLIMQEHKLWYVKAMKNLAESKVGFEQSSTP